MRLALFDLDNTLLDGDSDHAWGDFIVEQGLVDADIMKTANDEFYRQYQQGNLNIMEYLEFALTFLKEHSAKELYQWREQFIEEKIKPIILPAAVKLVEKHQQAGDCCVIITATNDFVTAPIADLFNIKHLIATTAECLDGEYTGNVSGTPCYKEGKVTRLQQWLDDYNSQSKNPLSLDGSIFYSDSQTDIPLLEIVDSPVATNPNTQLMEYAKEKQWPILNLR